jgi:hypothetical protein
MDPITMGLLTGAAGNLVQGIGKIVPSAFEIEQNKRLKKLQEQETAGVLGLNASERSILENRLASRGDAAAEQAKQERERYLAGGGGATAGTNMLSAQIGEGALRQQGTAISQAIEEANMAKAAVQTDEIRALEAAKAQYASDRIAALTSIAGGAIEGGITSSANKAAESGARSPSSNALSAVGKLYGLNDDQARGLLEITASNPEAAALFGKLKK